MKRPRIAVSAWPAKANDWIPQLLPRLKGEEVGTFFVEVGKGQLAGTVFQHIDIFFGEVQADLKNGDVVGDGGGLRAQVTDRSRRDEQTAISAFELKTAKLAANEKFGARQGGGGTRAA